MAIRGWLFAAILDRIARLAFPPPGVAASCAYLASGTARKGCQQIATHQIRGEGRSGHHVDKLCWERFPADPSRESRFRELALSESPFSLACPGKAC